MLTYEQMFKKLKGDLIVKTQIYFKLENQISQNKFTDSASTEHYLKTEEEWVKASKTYTEFFSEHSRQRH